MDLHDIFQEEYYGSLGFEAFPGKVRGLEIWTFQGATPFIRDEVLDITSPNSNDLDLWLEKNGRFELPGIVVSGNHISASLRLLYFSPPTAPHSDLPFALDSWKRVVAALRLPKAYSAVLSYEGQAQGTMVLSDRSEGSHIGLIAHSPKFNGLFTSIALSFDPQEMSTLAFLASVNAPGESPGVVLLEKLLKAPTLIHDPLSLLTVLVDTWVKQLGSHHILAHHKMQDIQRDTGLLNDFLARSEPQGQERNFDLMHERIVLQHAFLTNGMADYVASFRESLPLIFNKFEAMQSQCQSATMHKTLQARQNFEFLRLQIDAEIAFQKRLLARITVYLQVLYNLMQQEISRDARKDTAALKSISVLTMVFLPATAVATIASPFFRMNDDDTIHMSSQFGLFWAVAIPVTVIVIFSWMVWTNWKQVRELPGRLQKWWGKKPRSTASSLMTSSLARTTLIETGHVSV